MLENRYKWKILSKKKTFFINIKKYFKLSNITAAILASRFQNLKQIKKFFSNSTERLINPNRLFNIDLLRSYIKGLIHEHQKILVYGDYDADGVTSTSILYKTLKILGAEVSYFIPDRFKDGYGPNLKVYRDLIKRGFKAIIAIDNGITGEKAAQLAKKYNVKYFVIDHHSIPPTLPAASVIIHTDLSPDYTFKNLSAAGLAYKIAVYFLGKKKAKIFLPLLAVGEIADVMPVIGENRILIDKGLEEMRRHANKGLDLLAQKAHLNVTRMTSEDIAFKIAPRINSLGRMENANPLVKFLCTSSNENVKELKKIATQVEKANEKRKEVSNRIFSLAKKQVINNPHKIIICKGKNWHEGVLGIVAGKLAQNFNRPTLVFSIKNGIAKGSARSVGDFNIFNLLKKYQNFFLTFGGHQFAAGLSLSQNLFSQFFQAINSINYDFSKKEIMVDYLSTNHKKISFHDIQELNKLEPFGEGNPKPIIELFFMQLSKIKFMGKNNEHVKLKLQGFEGDILFFNRPDLQDKFHFGERLSVIGQLSINEWRGKISLQLIGLDIRSEGKVPNRHIFGNVYRYYCNKKIIYSPNDFYQKVFLELGFVKIKDGFVYIDKNAKHTQLSQSETFRKRAQIQYDN